MKPGFAAALRGGLLFACAALHLTPATADTDIRVMAANITSGNNQSYDPGEGTRIFKGLKPDVVLIQEFNYGDNSAAAIAGWVSSTFGSGYAYYREAGAQIPNGVISRWPIVASGEWDDPYVSNRDFAWARIDIPGDHDLWAVSVHLLTSSAGTRNSEAASLRSFIQAQVPAGDYLVIGGDFNTGSRSEAALSTLASVVITAGPWPLDTAGNGNTNASRAKPYDWVLADGDLAAHEVPLDLGANAFQNGIVFDSRNYSPLSEVAPVQAGDSGATNMQHMAVMRQFRVPDAGGGTGGGTPVTLLNTSGSVAQGAWKNYSVSVPAGATQLQITLAGTGDGDLYVRAGTAYPTLSQYDYRPYLSGSNESVSITPASSPPLQAGPYWISVYGYTAASFTISAVVQP